MAIFRGTNGNDNLVGDDVANGGDLMNGFGGDDTLSGLGGNDNINGDAGNDKLFGGAGNDLLDGGPRRGPFTDNDTLDGGEGIDTATYSRVQHGMTVNLNVGQAFNAGGASTMWTLWSRSRTPPGRTSTTTCSAMAAPTASRAPVAMT